jgi:abnormal spindle-like microcephaly-associated protein
VRLARLMELLTHTGDISTALRVPAVSRLQKLHNVGLVFKKFKGIKMAGGEGKDEVFLEHQNFYL